MNFYKVSKSGKLRKNKNDPRSAQYLYYTYDYYLKHKVTMDDLRKLAKYGFANKLEKRLLAPKLITQIS